MIISCGIYKITNTTNNRCYIGSSININKRWNEHKNNLRKNKHDNDFLQKSWNKHGENSFLFEIIEIVPNPNILIIREQYYLDLLKPHNKNICYNICKIAGNMLGFKHSNESKVKMSESHMGNQYSLGYKHTDESKNKMSKSHVDMKHKEETILKMIIIGSNRIQSEETKIKLSNINKGKKSSNMIRVYQLDLNDNIIKLWDSLTDAANEFNVSASQICGVCNGRKKTCLGFKWKYFEENKRLLLTIEKFNDIKDKYKTGQYSTRKLGQLYNISKSTIWNIVRN